FRRVLFRSKRDANNYDQYAESLNAIVEDVTKRKDQALFEYTKKIDKTDLNSNNIRVTEEEIQEALNTIDPKLLEVMKKAMKNIRAYHEKQKQYSWFDSQPNGTMLGQKVTALESVGVYVPGGKA